MIKGSRDDGRRFGTEAPNPGSATRSMGAAGAETPTRSSASPRPLACLQLRRIPSHEYKSLELKSPCGMSWREPAADPNVTVNNLESSRLWSLGTARSRLSSEPPDWRWSEAWVAVRERFTWEMLRARPASSDSQTHDITASPPRASDPREERRVRTVLGCFLSANQTSGSCSISINQSRSTYRCYRGTRG